MSELKPKIVNLTGVGLILEDGQHIPPDGWVSMLAEIEDVSTSYRAVFDLPLYSVVPIKYRVMYKNGGRYTFSSMCTLLQHLEHRYREYCPVLMIIPQSLVLQLNIRRAYEALDSTLSPQQMCFPKRMWFFYPVKDGDVVKLVEAIEPIEPMDKF